MQYKILFSFFGIRYIVVEVEMIIYAVGAGVQQVRGKGKLDLPKGRQEEDKEHRSKPFTIYNNSIECQSYCYLCPKWI